MRRTLVVRAFPDGKSCHRQNRQFLPPLERCSGVTGVVFTRFLVRPSRDHSAWFQLVSEPCRRQGVERHARLTGILKPIVNGHEQPRVDGIPPWNYTETV